LVGIFLKDEVEALFTGNIVFVGAMLLVTALLLVLSHFTPSGKRKIGFLDSVLIGIAQALAVIPGISRSGATITTALFIGNRRDEAARFSFLMVIIPILAANFMDLLGSETETVVKTEAIPLIVGFMAAFISGLLACRWMINIVRKGKLLYFGLYCFLVGSIAIIAGLTG